jgi:asparagine synthase (glutamine-hydrolysing)
MYHRGPDDGGSFEAPGVWLGHRRLAIIDLSDGGHQPLEDEATGVVLVYNGELFNYLELRRELEGRGHHFRSRSDTEVLLRAYLEWGRECVTRLNGMWAFVIWDPRAGRAFFSRDRFGIKPLFMANVPGGLALASEAKALLELEPSLRRPDVGAIAELLAQRRVCGDGRSFYEGISAVPAAHNGTFAPGDRAPALARYWDFPPTDASVSWEEAQERFAVLFETSVALRLRSDVPLAITLSGGLDSTAVLHASATALGADARMTAYTAVYEDTGPDGRPIDEREAASRAVAPYPQARLREMPAGSPDLLDVLRRIVWHMDGPGFSPAVFPLWEIMAGVRRDGVKVVLEGQGADELLGGYSTHLAAVLLDLVGQAVHERRPAALAAAVRSAGAVRGAFSPLRVLGDMADEVFAPAARWDQRRRTLRDVLDPALLPVWPGAEAVANGAGDRLRRRLLADFRADLLPGFLHYGDAVSMAHSVESRLPFLDHRLVELCFALPAAHKLRDGTTKAILRAYLDRAGQSEVARTRRKRGFPTPASQWLARDGGAVLREVLLAPGAAVAPYVRRDELARAIERHAGGMLAAGDALFGLLSTELWLRECIQAPGR